MIQANEGKSFKDLERIGQCKISLCHKIHKCEYKRE